MPTVETADAFAVRCGYKNPIDVADEVRERDAAIRRDELARVVKRLRELSAAESTRDPETFGDTGAALMQRKALIIACATTLTMAADILETER